MNLALDTLTFSEKMQAMEQLWENLSQTPTNTANPLVPKWHNDILQTRLQAVESGQSEFVDWKIAKEQLQAIVK